MRYPDDATTPQSPGARLPSLLAALQNLGGAAPDVTATGIAALFELADLREWSAVGDTWTPPAPRDPDFPERT